MRSCSRWERLGFADGRTLACRPRSGRRAAHPYAGEVDRYNSSRQGSRPRCPLPPFDLPALHERTNMDEFFELLSKHAHVVSGIAFTLLGLIVGWFLGYWRRHRLKKQVAGGDIRELLIVEQVLVKE